MNFQICQMGKLPNQIREIRKKLGLTLEQLAEASRISVGYIGRIETGDRPLSSKHIHNIASALGVSASDLFSGSGRPGVPILGYVGLGEEVEYQGEDQHLGYIDIAGIVETEGLGALIARGTSMMPRINNNEVIVYRRNGKRPADLIGREAVVKILEGPILFKRIRRGYEEGRFNLESHNANTRENQIIEWAGELVMILPEGEWTHR